MVTLALAGLTLLSQTKNVEPYVAVENLHRALIARFEDLSATKNGTFGVGRVEFDGIKAHGNKWTQGVDTTGIQYNVLIFSNKGKPLDPANLILRYMHNINLVTRIQGIELPTDKELRGWTNALAKETAEEAVKRDFKNHVVSRGTIYMEGRAIRLSKPECLKCHEPMKLNDPAAVVVYTTAPYKK